MEKAYYWTSNKSYTAYTLKIYHDSKLISTLTKIDSQLLSECVKALKEDGYVHKYIK